MFLEILNYDPNNVNIKQLSEKHDLNGREIKNTLKLAKVNINTMNENE